MKVKATTAEIAAFYMWLQGKFSRKQPDNLLPVYVACPEERKVLLLEFLRQFNAEHRYRVMCMALGRGI